MKVKPYEKLAEIYDGLMKKVDYVNWSKYIIDIAKNYISDDANVLELASGNCKMAELISRKYRNYVCSDISISMLKAGSNRLNKICCDMTQPPFKKKFDFVFSAFDSVNYLLRIKTLRRLFDEIYLLLSNEGIFTFDVSLENNSLKLIKKEITEENYNGCNFTRTSIYNKRNKTHYNKFIMIDRKDGVFKETHKQKIYDFNTYFKLAENSGFYVDACYKCFTFEKANSGSDRAQFVLRKINL
jgi:SAM-dependent methyltransferase